MEKTKSKSRLWTGRVMSILVILFMAMDGIMKFVKPEPVIAGTVELGYTTNHLFSMGLILLICTVLYAVPRTSILGAILLTGYLGGAVATHFRLFNPLFSHTLFPIYLGILAWGGLVLRYPALKVFLTGRE